jgi:ribosome-associated protein
LDSKDKTLWCAHLALDKKALDLLILDVQQQSSFTSFFIICSGTSDRHVQAIASHIEASGKQAGVYPLGMEGLREGRWILLDYGDIVIHIFHEPVRKFYDLERLWTAAPRIPVEEGTQQILKTKSEIVKKPKAPRAAPKKRTKTK